MANDSAAASGKERARPLSPHLQVYRLPLLAILSISHRVTAIANMAGLAMVTWWLLAAASGPEAYGIVHDFMGSFFGRLFLFGWTLTLFYHLCNGVRHLVWDAGKGYELKTAYMSGYLVLGAAVGLTFLVWIVGYAVQI